MIKEKLRENLPVIIARKAVRKYLGSVVAPGTLANHDSKGTGPRGMFKIGRTVVYPTDALLDWLEERGRI